MNVYIYWSNKNVWHDERLAEISADAISEADKKFTDLTGYEPVKCPWIGVQIFKQDTSMHKIWFIAGSDAVIKENGEDAIQSRTFETEAELNAFWDGVETAIGFDDIFTGETEEEVKEHVREITDTP